RLAARPRRRRVDRRRLARYVLPHPRRRARQGHDPPDRRRRAVLVGNRPRAAYPAGRHRRVRAAPQRVVPRRVRAGAVGRLDVLTIGSAPAELRAVVLLFKAAPRAIRNAINRDTRAALNPVWRGLVAQRARGRFDQLVIVRGARIKAGNPPAAVAATSKRALSGGLVPGDKWYAAEFGADRGKVETYDRRSPSGGTHTVTRHTARQLPARTKRGRVAYAALADIAPRAVSLWAHIIVRRINDDLRGERH